MNRSRHRVSAAHTLVVTLIVGLMSVLCLAPVHAVSFLPTERFAAEPASDSVMQAPQKDAQSDEGGSTEEPIVVDKDAGSTAPAGEDSTRPAGEPAPSAPADEGTGESPGTTVPPADAGTSEPAPAAPTEEPAPEVSPGTDSSGESPSGDTTGEGTPGGETVPGGSGADDLAGTDGNPLTDGGLTLHPAPGTLPQAQVGEPYSARLTADGGAGGAYAYQVVGAELLPLPAGLSLDRTSGVLSGVPTAVGKYSFTIEVSTQGEAAPILQAYSMSVQGADLGISVPGGNDAALTTAEVGEPLVVKFDTSGGVGPYSYSIGGAQLADAGNLRSPRAQAARRSMQERSSVLADTELPPPVSVRQVEGAAAGGSAVGNLPAPLKLDSSGTLQGIPQTPGTYQFTVISTDRYGSSASHEFTLTILRAGAQSPTEGKAVEQQSPGSDEAKLSDQPGMDAAATPLANTGASLALLFAGLASLGVGTGLLLWQAARRREPALH